MLNFFLKNKKKKQVWPKHPWTIKNESHLLQVYHPDFKLDHRAVVMRKEKNRIIDLETDTWIEELALRTHS